MASGDEPSVAVYVVKVGHKTLSDAVVGAVYWTEEEAQQEVKRLNDANGFVRASYVCRWLSEPEWMKPKTVVGWGQE